MAVGVTLLVSLSATPAVPLGALLLQEIRKFDQLVPEQTLLGGQAVRIGDIRIGAMIQQEGDHLHRLLRVRRQDDERDAAHPRMPGVH